MKKKLTALLFILGLAAAPLTANAAQCTQGGVTVTGDVCTVIAGDCACWDKPAP